MSEDWKREELTHLAQTAAELVAGVLPEGVAFVLHVLPACGSGRNGPAVLVADNLCRGHVVATLGQAKDAMEGAPASPAPLHKSGRA